MTFSSTDERHLSTYKHTNAVPQCRGFNVGRWSQFEALVRAFAVNQCIPLNGILYLLTGTSFAGIQPGNPPQLFRVPVTQLPAVPIPNNPVIDIPNSMWTAGCCVYPAGNPRSFAVIGNNIAQSNGIQITLLQLQNFLLEDVGPVPGLDIGGPNVELFPGNLNC